MSCFMNLINVMSCSGTPILLSAGLSAAPGTVSYAFLMSSNVSIKEELVLSAMSMMDLMVYIEFDVDIPL